MAVALKEVQRFLEEPSRIAVWVVVFDENRERVLLVRERRERKLGLVGFPGGKPKQGSLETHKEAGVRELKEETGLIVEPENLISYENNIRLGDFLRSGEQKYYAGKVFIATQTEGELKRKTPETTVFWARIDKLDRFGRRLSPTVKPVVQEALDYLQSNR